MNTFPREALIVAALVGLASFSIEITNLNLSIDDEVALYEGAVPTLWIARGRWGLFALSRLLFPYPVIPNGPLLFSVLLMAVSAVLLSKQWRLERQADIALVASAMVSLPILSHILQFSTMSAGIGPGFLAVALATVFIGDKASPARLLLVSLLITVAMSFYQAFLVVALSAFIVKLALSRNESARGEPLLKWLLLSALCAGVGYGAHALATRALTSAFQIPADSYIGELQAFPESWAELMFRVQQNLALAQRIVLGSSDVFGIHVYFLPVTIGFCVALAVVMVVAKGGQRRWMLQAVVLLASLFALNILAAASSKHVAIRFMLGFAVVVGAWLVFALTLSRSSPPLRDVTVCLALLTIFQFVQSNNRLLSSAKLAYEIDQSVAQQLIYEIRRLESETGATSKHLEISGYWRPEDTPAIARAEVIGASFFEWDGGNPFRVGYFLGANGLRLLPPAPLEKRVKAFQASLSMPTWPATGSVSIVDEVAVIKFGPLSQPQLAWIDWACHQQGNVATSVQRELSELCEKAKAH